MKFKKNISILCALVIVLLLGLGITPIPSAKAQFVIAAYTYDTTNDGNYIAYIQTYVDSVYNGSVYKNSISYPGESFSNPKEIQAGVNLTLAVFCWVNGTATGISSLAEGLNIIRHNVTVVCNNGTTIFSQQNFTYVIGTDGNAPMYFYRHDVILDFVLVGGEIYTVTVNYEVYY